LFPEYNSNTNEDISPDSDTTFNGWVLWSTKLKIKTWVS
jgi:hypothetical protein